MLSKISSGKRNDRCSRRPVGDAPQAASRSIGASHSEAATTLSPHLNPLPQGEGDAPAPGEGERLVLQAIERIACAVSSPAAKTAKDLSLLENAHPACEVPHRLRDSG